MIDKTLFGVLPDGRPCHLYRLRNSLRTEISICEYGACITFLKTLDRAGKLDDIVLGFDSLDAYLTEIYRRTMPYFGATIGRCANRIGDAKFSLDGQTYKLPANNDGNLLHGGENGFHTVLWQGRDVSADTAESAVEFTYASADGEEGFPGNADVKVKFALTDENELKIEYTATTDRATIVNLTNHTYFNLRGKGDILKHELQIDAERFTPVDEKLIPTGDLKSVAETPFDFREAKEIGRDIDAPNEQIKIAGGYDHNFVLSGETGELKRAATVTEPNSGRKLEIYTTEPGLQFYSGNFLDGSLTRKNGAPLEKNSGFCLETQHFPDSPNRPDFPPVVLLPNETFYSRTVWKFSVA